MLSIEECRKLIPDSEKFTDEEILDIKRRLYDLAELAFECWLQENKNQK